MEDDVKIYVCQMKQNGGYFQNLRVSDETKWRIFSYHTCLRWNKMEVILKIHGCQMKQNGGYSQNLRVSDETKWKLFSKSTCVKRNKMENSSNIRVSNKTKWRIFLKFTYQMKNFNIWSKKVNFFLINLHFQILVYSYY